MKQIITSMYNRTLLSKIPCRFSTSGFDDPSFLQMVESYFDKAGKHTNIPADRLNYYKKPECVVKFNLTLNRGTTFYDFRRRFHLDDPGLPLPAQNSQAAD